MEKEEEAAVVPGIADDACMAEVSVIADDACIMASVEDVA